MSDSLDDGKQDRLVKLLEGLGSNGIREDLLSDLCAEELAEFEKAREALEILQRVDRKASSESTMCENPAETAGNLQPIISFVIGDAALADGETSEEFRRLGHYELLEMVGQGGFAVVYAARDTKLGRKVALKIPRIHSLDEDKEVRERFAREARLIAMLSHPGILPVFETGSDGPFIYIATAWCSGGNLADWRAQQRLPADHLLAARITARLAEAVQHAHARGVIHRDLKPGNVLLEKKCAPEGCETELIDSLRIADFGLARLSADDSAMTRTGATIGTPAYMSPEQARGATSEIGPTTDVYALGAILYELLTGKPPIVGSSNVATLRAIESQQPKAPSRLNRSVPADLDAICLKCLEKHPRDRYESAHELAEDLQRFVRGEPVVARPIGPATRLKRWAVRNPLIAGSLGLALVSLITGLAVSIAFAVRSNRAMNLAQEKQKVAEEKSAEALVQARMTREAVDRLHRAIASDRKLLSEGSEKLKLALAQAAKDYYQTVALHRPNDRDVLREYVDTLRGLAHLLQLTGNHEDSAAVWEEAAGIMEDEFPEDLVNWAMLRSKLAEDRLVTGKVVEAVSITGELVDRLTETASADPSEEVLTRLVFQMVNSAQTLSHQGRAVQADSLVDQAIELVAVITGQPPEQWPAKRTWARVLRCKSEVSIQRENHDDVDRFAPLAIEQYDRIMTEDPSRTSEALDSMASMHQSLGNSLQARERFDEAIEEFESGAVLMQQLMDRHPDVGGLCFNWSNFLNRYCTTLIKAESFEEARDRLESHLPWLAEQQEKYPQMMPLFRITEIESRELLHRVHAHLGNREQAMAELETAIAVCERECESEQAPLGLRAFLGNLYNLKAKTLLESDQVDSAVEILNRSISLLEPIVAENPTGDPARFLSDAQDLLAQADRKE